MRTDEIDYEGKWTAPAPWGIVFYVNGEADKPENADSLCDAIGIAEDWIGYCHRCGQEECCAFLYAGPLQADEIPDPSEADFQVRPGYDEDAYEHFYELEGYGPFGTSMLASESGAAS